MAEDSGSGATPWLAFLVGGLLVVVAVIAFFMYSGNAPSSTKSVNLNVKAPDISVPAPAPAKDG